MKKIIVLLITALCWQGWCTGQQSLAVAGIEGSGTGGMLSATIGQFDYGILAGGNVILVAGVQQPFEIQVVTGTDPLADILPGCSVFPNPATRALILKIPGEKTGELTYRLVGADGKILEEGPVQDNETRISMDGYKASLYFLRVMKQSDNLKTFKIIKN